MVSGSKATALLLDAGLTLGNDSLRHDVGMVWILGALIVALILLIAFFK